MEAILAGAVIADKGYDSNALIETIEAADTQAIIPPRRNLPQAGKLLVCEKEKPASSSAPARIDVFFQLTLPLFYTSSKNSTNERCVLNTRDISSRFFTAFTAHQPFV